MEKLAEDLCVLICQTCNIKEYDLATIDPQGQLIGPDSVLGLDSLDAVEIVVTVQNKYGVQIGSEETSRELLTSLQTLADFVGTKNGPGITEEV